MTDRKRNPEEILEEMLNKHVLSEKLEIGSGLLAGAGTIFLGVVKNAAFFAAAPLTLAIAINYFNRMRMGQISRYQTHVEVAEVQRRLSSEIQGLRGQSQEGSGTLELADAGQIQNAVISLSETVAALEMQVQQGGASGGEPSHLQEELVQLRNHQLDLSQSLEAVNQQLRGLSTEAPTANFSSELSELKAQFSQLQSSPMPSDNTAGVEIDAVRTEFRDLLQPIHSHLSDLESRLAQASQTSSAAAPASEELQTVHGQMNALNEKLENVAAQLSAEMAGFQQSVEQAQDRVQAVHQQVEAVHQNVAATPAGASVESIHQEMQGVIGPLHEQLAALEHKLSNMPVADPSLSQIQAEQMISLQNQLNSTNGLIEEMTTQLSSRMTDELSKIPQLVEAQVTHKVANLQPAPPQDKKQDALSELDSILADINL